MDFEEILGLAAGILTTGANIPQTIKVIRTRSTKSLSAPTYAMLFIGMACWVAYGIERDDVPVILANAVAGTLCGIILFMKLLGKYRSRPPHRQVLK